jgi:hypothetical protein
MPPLRTVTLYVANRLDGAIEVDPVELADEFIQAALWWLSGTPGRNSSWDEEDWDALADALAAQLKDQPEVRDQLWKRVCS